MWMSKVIGSASLRGTDGQRNPGKKPDRAAPLAMTRLFHLSIGFAMQIPLQVEQARKLVGEGRKREALEFLNDLSARGDAAASYELAEWCREGEIVGRDFALARDFYLRAAQGGLIESYKRYMALLAVGVGGPRDWATAIQLLADLAKVDASGAAQKGVLDAMKLTSEGDPADAPVREVVSESAHIYRFPSLFSDAECEFLNETAEPLFEPAKTVEEYTHREIRNPIRTSDTAAFPWVGENPVIHALNRRIAAASGTSTEQGEPLQVLRYRQGQEYKPHTDAVPGLENQRVMTMLVYLNDDFEGGDTEFPKLGITIRPRRGEGLLFRNVDEEGRADPSLLHAGMPVRTGVKLLASRWIRERPVTG
jgi:prolyl 4-hydroxylase